MRYLKAGIGAALAALAIGVLALPASAHTGDVVGQQDCEAWSVSVSLNHNTTTDRTVNVLTTIPGTTGITGGHYGTDKGEIWSAGGPAPTTGTVTLNILNDGQLEFTDSFTLLPQEDCVEETTTTTEEPTTTTTAPATTTTVPTTVTTRQLTCPDVETPALQCPEPTTSTTEPPTSTTVVVCPATGACAPKAAAQPELPFTGGLTAPLAAGAACLIALGVAVQRGRRQHVTQRG